MNIKPSASIRQNYNDIAELCRSTGEPVYLTKNGEGDLVVMDINSFTKREKMLKLSSIKTYTLDEIRKIVSKLAAQYGAKRVYLFGSFARGDMTDSSDIDLRIDKGSIKGFQLAGLLLDLEDSLGRPVDLVPTTSLDQHFLDFIHDDEMLLYEAS